MIGQFETSAVVSSRLEQGYYVPASIAENNLTSGTSKALECFTNQAFSEKLQMFLINYVVVTSGYYSIYVD